MKTIARHFSIAVALAAMTACDEGTTAPNPCDANPASCAATISADITASRTLHADTVYTLGAYVHVTGAGTVLTIEPGTVIKGTASSALFVLPGARIMANGTADDPIVFTSDQPIGSRMPGDWGGLIIVGNGIINRSGTVLLEGTNTGGSNVAVNYNGGNNNADNSGTLRYVRVEFAGFGVNPNQELNSFTFAAVGSGTTLEYLQSLAGLDDSFEWFGGAVDSKYLVSYEAGDDHFDAAEGYTGRNQFLIAFQSLILPPRPIGGNTRSADPQGFEVDGCGSSTGSGCDLGFNSSPLNTPLFANFTVVGTGPNNDVAATSGGVGVLLRRGTAGIYVNGIVARWPRAALSLQNTETQARFTSVEAVLRNVLVVEAGTTAGGANSPLFEGGTNRFTIDAGANSLVEAAGTVTTASIFTALPATPANAAALDWSLPTTSPAQTGGTGAFSGALATKAGSFVTGTTFRGAADPFFDEVVAGLDQLRAQLSSRISPWRRAAGVALALAVSCGDSSVGKDRRTTPTTQGEGGASVSLDSALKLFRRNLEPVTELQDSERSIAGLVARLKKAVEQSDTIALRALVMSRREFAWLYYPTSAFTRAPTKQEPGLAWFLHLQASQKGVTRLLNQYGGRPLRLVNNECKGPPRVEGINRLWVDCVQRLIEEEGDSSVTHLFGGIFERNGRFKIFSYSNDL